MEGERMARASDSVRYRLFCAAREWELEHHRRIERVILTAPKSKTVYLGSMPPVVLSRMEHEILLLEWDWIHDGDYVHPAEGQPYHWRGVPYVVKVND